MPVHYGTTDTDACGIVLEAKTVLVLRFFFLRLTLALIGDPEMQ